jgi:hypothetical protein
LPSVRTFGGSCRMALPASRSLLIRAMPKGYPANPVGSARLAACNRYSDPSARAPHLAGCSFDSPQTMTLGSISKSRFLF